MKKRTLDYLAKIDSLLKEDKETTNWQEEANLHLIQIRIFQHERLLHLIVTVTFALLTFMAILSSLSSFFLPLLLLILLLLSLLVPYIFHYYLLENSVQKMYNQYDALLLKTRNE